MDAAGFDLRKVSDEVFVAETPIFRVGPRQVEFLKRQAALSPRRRARICAHRSSDDRLHEMVIALAADSYVAPHKHLDNVESFHVVEGSVDVVFFGDAGEIVDLVELGDPRTGRDFFYRLSESVYHTLLIRSDFLVVHEVTGGPFRREKTVYAPFAPPESRPEEARAYLAGVARAADAHARGA